MSKFKMTKQDMLAFNDACDAAVSQCPQCRGYAVEDRDILLKKITPKQLIKHWLRCRTLWDSGYDECLGLDASEVFRSYSLWKAAKKYEKTKMSEEV